ncbi:MAG: M20 family metallopeptidase [Ruminococcaceae bacterium]|nr:M20 family metallopeptidase [Oscillospiraceae bacterium]
MEIKNICQLIDSKKEELFELLCKLIRINSEDFGDHGNEQECAEYIRDLCIEMGMETDMYSPLEIEGFSEHPDYMPGRNLENRYNTVARWRGEEDCDHLMLMGHSDTVRIGDLNNWEFEPTAGFVKDGKVFGRGACDDKYALATALFIIKLLKEQGFKPKKNLVFAAYSDEEYGGSHGAMAAVMKYPCKHIVNMDCKENLIWHCGSGGGEMKYLFHTKEPVDSAGLTASAIPVIMEELEAFAQRRRTELGNNRYYKGTIIPSTAMRYMGVRAGNGGSDLGMGEVYFVFYTDKTKDEIYKEFAQLHEVISKKLDAMGIVGDGFVPNTRFFHYVHCEPDSEDIKLMLEASRETTGKEPLVCGSCLSDLSVISKYGSDRAFGFGIGRDFNKIGGAHQPNEFIECDKLVDYAKTIAAYVIKMLG